MFPGAPRPHKGVEDVLIALDKLNQPDLKLVIVGSNPYDDYDKKLIKKWGNRIVKLSKFPVETMPEVLAAADVVVVPQRKNYTTLAQFPLKLTDGMAMGKPILSTKVGDIPQILGDTGYLVEPDSPEEIAEQDIAGARAKMETRLKPKSDMFICRPLPRIWKRLDERVVASK